MEGGGGIGGGGEVVPGVDLAEVRRLEHDIAAFLENGDGIEEEGDGQYGDGRDENAGESGKRST